MQEHKSPLEIVLSIGLTLAVVAGLAWWMLHPYFGVMIAALQGGARLLP